MTASIDCSPEPGTTLRVAVIVAHPDDETLWAGGLLLSHPEWSSFVVTLCRGGDPDRAPRFLKALERLNSTGRMGTLDDGPDQIPLSTSTVKEAILALLPTPAYDLVLTHAPQGEYTWHRRHVEVSLAVQELWKEGNLKLQSLWEFAYEDGGGAYPPRAQGNASHRIALSEEIWQQKFGIIAEIYGFDKDSWEARATSRTEAFNCFTDPGGIPPPFQDSRVFRR